jgi:hypothetical protein
MANEKIEAAIEDRLLRAVNEDLSEKDVQELEHKIVTVRNLASE